MAAQSEQEVQAYLDLHKIQATVEEAINACVKANAPDPCAFMSQHLATKAAPETITKVKARQIFDSRGNPTIEVDVTSGLEHPFYVVIQTPAGPGLANTLRIINLNPVEFPFHAFILPYPVVLTSSSGDTEIVMGHEGSWAV